MDKTDLQIPTRNNEEHFRIKNFSRFKGLKGTVLKPACSSSIKEFI